MPRDDDMPNDDNSSQNNQQNLENQETLSPVYLSTIPCNTEVSIQIITPVQTIRVRSHLVGVDRQLCLILHRGNDAAWLSAKNYIREGQNLVVRLINSKENDAKVIAFRSSIIKLDSVISRWLIISFPKQVQAIKLRKDSRQSLKLKASLITAAEQKTLSSGFLNDISLSGCAYLGQALAEEEQEQKLLLCTQIQESELTSPDSPPEILNLQLPIEIKNKSNDSSGVCKMGLQFTSSEEERLDAVQKILMQSLLS